MKTITIKEFQTDFDNVISQVEKGHQYLIESENGNVLLMPYGIYDDSDNDDLIKIHTDHNEGM